MKYTKAMIEAIELEVEDVVLTIIFKGGVHIEIYKGYDRGYRAGG